MPREALQRAGAELGPGDEAVVVPVEPRRRARRTQPAALAELRPAAAFATLRALLGARLAGVAELPAGEPAVVVPV